VSSLFNIENEKMAKQVKLKQNHGRTWDDPPYGKLRARGLIPAVIYGGNDKPQPLQVATREINAMMSHASGENVLVNWRLPAKGSSRTRSCRRCNTRLSVVKFVMWTFTPSPWTR